MPDLSWSRFFETGLYFAAWEAVDAGLFAWKDKVRGIAGRIAV